MPRRLFAMLQAMWLILLDMFSVKMIIPTLFAPWHRDVIPLDNLSLQEKFSAALLNLTSRFVGFVVKSFVFIAFIVFSVATLAIFTVAFVGWFFFPILIAILLVEGIMHIF